MTGVGDAPSRRAWGSLESDIMTVLWAAGEELVVCASEAGVVDFAPGETVRRGRVAPGQMVLVDPDRGLLLDSELKRELAARQPYARWLADWRRRGTTGEPSFAAILQRHRSPDHVWTMQELLAYPLYPPRTRPEDLSEHMRRY